MVSTIPSLFTLINTTSHKLITILPFFYLKMFRKVQRRNFTFIGKRTEYNLRCTYTQYTYTVQGFTLWTQNHHFY